jgi:hypothetical protein
MGETIDRWHRRYFGIGPSDLQSLHSSTRRRGLSGGLKPRSHAFFFDYTVIFFSRAAPLICGAVPTRQSGLHAATHFSFGTNENEWPSRRAAAQFSVLHEQEPKPRNPGFRLLNVDCSRVLDLASSGADSSRRHDVSNDHTLTAVDPLVV